MTIQLTCDCGAKLRATEAQMGKLFQCPNCKSPVRVVPAPSTNLDAQTAPPIEESSPDGSSARMNGSSTRTSLGNAAETGTPQVSSSLIARAVANDGDAIVTMFQQFIPRDEKVIFAEYLGTQGILGLGEQSFGCLTTRRIASIRTKRFGEVLYQDGFLEYINSTVVYQPSKVVLYIIIVVLLALAIPTFGATLLVVPFAGTIFYQFKKSGVVFVVKEGVSVYFFANRKLLARANVLIRDSTRLRDERVKLVGTG